MRTVSQSAQTAWNNFGYVSKRIYVPELDLSIPDSNITDIELTESISDEECLFFVGCISSEVKISLDNFTTDILSKEIEIYVSKNNNEELKAFKGKIFSFEIDARNNSASGIAYDALYEAFNTDMTSWYTLLNLPMTMLNFRNALFTQLGITQNAASLLNDNFIIQRTIGGDSILGRDLIRPLCEANAVFGKIDYNGNFSYISLTENVRNSTISELSDFVKQDFITNTIDKVIVRTDEDDIGMVAGAGSNAYIVEGNMYFLGLSSLELQTIADSYLSALDEYSYRPFEATEQYNPIYELGDKISLPDAFGNTYVSYILQRTTDFQSETITAKGLLNYSESASYSNESLIKLRGKTNRLYRSVEETRSEITDVESALHAEIVQTAEGIQVQIQDLQSQIDGETAYYEREGTPTLLNYPYWDFCTNIPCNNTVQTTDDLTFIYTEQNRKDHRSDLCFDTQNNIGYRFVQENGVWYWKEVADSDFTQIMSRLSTLEATAEELSSEYTEISATVTEQGITISQHSSLIQQNANSITSLVRATTDTNNSDSLQSQITQQANLINAKVSSTGGSASSFAYELTSTNFKLISNNQIVFQADSTGISTFRVEGTALKVRTLEVAMDDVKIAGKKVYQRSYSNYSETFYAVNVSRLPTVYSSVAGGYILTQPVYCTPITISYSKITGLDLVDKILVVS